MRSEFHVDMNGKKMLWQGVALLPFIDQQRLLTAIATVLPSLSDDEKRRNTRGRDVIFVHEHNPLYSQISGLYAGRPAKDVSAIALDWGELIVTQPVLIDWKRSNRILGFIAADPECVPGSTYFSPLTVEGEADIDNDSSLGASFFFPEQRVPHRSVLLAGAKPQRGHLSNHDVELVRRGGTADNRPQGNGFHSNRRDIDGIGVRRASDRPTHPQSYGRPAEQHRSFSGNNSRYDSNPQGYGQSNNYGQQAQKPYSYQPPAPSYQPPAQSYQAPYQSSYGAGPTYTPPSAYASYGQHQPQPPAPVYQPPAPTFNNAQAMGLPPHLQHLNRPAAPPAQPAYPNFGQANQQRNPYVYKR
jgi:5'-3' exoribonuclease 2